MGDNFWILILVLFALAFGGAFVFLLLRLGRKVEVPVRTTHTIAERVRSVGKVVGLEVCAKEITTQTAGWSWLPPILMSQARLAMIFNFEKQYYVDLTRVRERDVEELSPGRYRVTLPSVEGVLRLIDVTPYDVQAGRVMGLVDVIPMTAERQGDLMKQAQLQAAELYEKNDRKYLDEAKASIERHMTSLLGMFDVRVQWEWREQTPEDSRLAKVEAASQG